MMSSLFKIHTHYSPLTLVAFLYSIFSLSLLHAFSSEQISVKDEQGLYRILVQDTIEGAIKVDSPTEDSIKIQSFDPSSLKKLYKILSAKNLNKNYIRSLEMKDDENILVINLTTKAIDAFSFYEREKKTIYIDLWNNPDKAIKTIESNKKVVNSPKKTEKKITKKQSPEPKDQFKEIEKKMTFSHVISKEKQDKAYTKDFRYGASLIWPYPALTPKVPALFDVHKKSLSHLYEVQNLEEEKKDEERSHLQLAINFYKREKWGLMIRTIRLYRQRFGMEMNKDLLRFMELEAITSSLVKRRDMDKFNPQMILTMEHPEEEVIVRDENKIYFSLIKAMKELADSTTSLPMKLALQTYVTHLYANQDDSYNTLIEARKLYVVSSKIIDDEKIAWSAKTIMRLLSETREYEKLKVFSQSMNLKRIFSQYELLTYTTLVRFIRGEYKTIIDEFEKNDKLILDKLSESTLFHLAESYFQEGYLNQALKHFDEYLKNYSYTDFQERARLRLALCYDLLGKDDKATEKLYEMAYNRATSLELISESALRWMGLKILRASRGLVKNPDEYLTLIDKASEKQKLFDNNPDKVEEHNRLKELLWIVRYRSFLALRDWKKGLAYYNLIPIEKVDLQTKKIFINDAKENLLGYLNKLYEEEKFIDLMKNWDILKGKVFSQKKYDQRILFLLAASQVKLGLNKGLERTKRELERSLNFKQRIFPQWSEVKYRKNFNEYLNELNVINLIQKKNYQKALKVVEKSDIDRKDFYKIRTLSLMKDYKKVITEFEKYILSKDLLNHQDKARVIQDYINAFYQERPEEFLVRGESLLADLNRHVKKIQGEENNSDLSQWPYYNVKRDLEFKILESLHEKGGPLQRIVDISNNLIKEDEKSPRLSRVKFIQAKAYLKNKKKEQASRLLKDLKESEDTPEYLKKMVETELTFLELEKKIL